MLQLTCCNLVLCHDLFLLLSVIDHAAGVGMELFGQWVLGSLSVVGLEVLVELHISYPSEWVISYCMTSGPIG